MAKIVTGVAMVAGAAITMVVAPEAAPAIIGKLAAMGMSVGASLTMGGIADELRGGAGYSGSIRQPAASRQVIYGQCRVTGTVIYTSTSGHQLNQVIAWASHPVKSIDAIYLDARQVYGLTNGTGNADGRDHYDANGTKYKFDSGKVWCESSYGTPDGKWLSSLNAQNRSFWGQDCILQGICATYIKTTYSDSQFSGIPQVKATIHGKCDIWDPRLGDRLNSDGTVNANSHGWADNWALCIADLLVNSDYGVGCSWDELDIDQLIAAANICDEAVPLANGKSEKRYTVNGFFDYSTTPGDTLASMLMAAEGRVTYTGGKFKIYPAAWYGTNLAFTQDDLIGGIKWTPRRKHRELANAVRATYVCPSYPYSIVGYDHDHPDTSVFDGQWQPTDAPEYAQDAAHGYASDANLTADGCKLYADRRYQFVTSCATVQRLMKIYLLRNRQQGAGNFRMKLSAYQAQAQDVIQFTLPQLGWNSKYLTVENFRFVPNMGDENEAPSLSCELDVAETEPAVYSWSTAEERGVENTPSPEILNPGDVDAPTGLTLKSDNTTALIGVDGVTVPRILASWDGITDPFVASGGCVQVQSQLAGASTWTNAGQITPDLNSCYIGAVVAGQTYNVRIAAVRGNGAMSAWTEADGHKVATIRSVLSAADVFLTDTTSLEAALNNISSDNVLSAGEKSSVITDVANINNEQDGIDALADFYGITTEKTAYDTAVSNLTSYLATLTSPVAWNDTTGSTTVDGATFRNKFEAVYSARTALANKASSTAKSLADTAKNTADSAQNTANTAKNRADSASSTASQAQTTANNAASQVASLATEAMRKADFLDANGKIPADSKVTPGSITSPLIAANAILAKNLTVANFDNLVPNPNSEQAAPTGGWPSGALEAVGVSSAWHYSGSKSRVFTPASGTSDLSIVSPNIPASAGESFYFEAMTACDPWAGSTRWLSIDYLNENGDWITGTYASERPGDGWLADGQSAWRKQSISGVAPAGTCFVRFNLFYRGGTSNAGNCCFDNLYARRMADANLIVDGAITASKIAAGAITAEKITLTAGDVKYTDGQTIDSLKPAQAGATNGATWGSNISGQPQDIQNLILKPTFEDGAAGSWGAWAVVPAAGQAFTKCLQTHSRDVLENNSFPAVSGERYYCSAYINSNETLYTACLGIRFDDAAGNVVTWSPGAGLAPGNGWTKVTGWLTVPANAVKGRPWLQQDGFDFAGSNSSAYFAQLYIGRFQPGSDVTSQNTAYDVQTGSDRAVRERGADVTGSNTAADVQTGDGKAVRQWGADVTSNNLSAGAQVSDTRNDSNPPSWYRVGTTHEFKGRSVIGAPGSAAYGTLDTYKPWADSSGGVATQTFNSENGTFIRKGGCGDSSWGAWVKSYDEQNKPRIGSGDIPDAGGLATKSVITSTELTSECVQTPHLAANSVVAAKIAAGQIDSSKLTTGALVVGGNGWANPGTIDVYNSGGGCIGHVGGSAGGSYGAWFQTLGVGGGSASNPNLYADSGGNLYLNGAVIQGTNGIAVDAAGNLQFKNKVRVNGVTYDPYTSSAVSGYMAFVPEMSVTLNVTNASNGVLIMFSGSLGISSNDGAIELEIRRDGTKIGPSFWSWCRNSSGCGLTAIFYDAADTGLTAGSHTYALYAWSFVGDSSHTAHWTGTNRSMAAVEMG